MVWVAVGCSSGSRQPRNLGFRIEGLRVYGLGGLGLRVLGLMV